jgi:glycosyltransferase involved in cell wall biosynthesis
MIRDDKREMGRVKVAQQVLDPSGSGGVSAEYRALLQSSLPERYDFHSIILTNCHHGVNWKDIQFYRDKIIDICPDIIHIRGAAPDGLNAVLAAKLANKGRILVTVHGMYSDLIYTSGIRRWISRHIIERLIYMLADGISCVCNTTNKRPCFKKYIKKMMPVVYNRMPNYADYDKELIRSKVREKLGISNEEIIGVFVGRITKEKGLSYLLDAFEQLDYRWPSDFTVMIIGDGVYLDELIDECARIKNSKKILFLHNQVDVHNYLLASDFFILPSLHENHSIALLEAAAAQLPCIATRVGGNEEIVHDGTTGLLVDSKSSQQLCNAIMKIVTDFSLRERLTNAAIQMKYPEYSDHAVDNQLDAVYKKMMSLP